MKLYEYQDEAIENLFDNILPKLKHNNNGSKEILKAPTGSGKTVMLSSLIDRLSDLEDYQLCFLWMTIGKGNLAIQSYNSLSKFLPSAKVSLLSSEFSGNRADIHQNEIVVINWEMVRSKKNVLRRQGETYSFQDIMENTRYKGIKPIIIIDESHTSADTKKANDVIDLIQPNVIVGASATPKDYTVVVPYSEPRDRGVVKNSVIVNDDMGISKELDETKYVLESAWAKDRIVRAKYSKAGVNTLTLINIENAKGGEDGDEIVIAEEFLKSKGVSVAGGNLAVWTTKRKENLDDINNWQSPVEFLIFKQAISTGWDCPRAGILVELRANMVEVFKHQVVGRILRMVERKHYGDSDMDNAFIFTNDREFSIVVDPDDPESIEPYYSGLKSEFKISLPSSYVKQNWNDIQVSDGKFLEYLYDVMEKKYGVA